MTNRISNGAAGEYELPANDDFSSWIRKISWKKTLESITLSKLRILIYFRLLKVSSLYWLIESPMAQRDNMNCQRNDIIEEETGNFWIKMVKEAPLGPPQGAPSRGLSVN